MLPVNPPCKGGKHNDHWVRHLLLVIVIGVYAGAAGAQFLMTEIEAAN